MLQTTVLLILLSAIIAIALAWFQYFYKGNRSARYNWFLLFLRAAGIFSVLLLLINPKISNTTYFTEKPNLLLAVDNSASIENNEDGLKVVQFISAITEHPEIRERFDIRVYSFGRELNRTDSLSFTEPQTNIQETLQDLNKIYRNTTAPTVLISDGNQTIGGNLQVQARSFDHPIIPVVIGDTVSYQDLSISRVNVNRYAFLENKFPVELFLNYMGEEAVTARLLIKIGGTSVYSSDVAFDQDGSSSVITALLPANTIGVSTYEAQLVPLENEKNIRNNKQSFVVEVIDERSRILLVTSLIHPDLGALKRSIERNQQREVEIALIGELPAAINDFDLVILYQPTSNFSGLWESLQEQEKNYWVITGPGTDWRFLNQVQAYFQKEITGQTEEFFPELNPGYSSFQLEDIGYSGFPPLIGSFGEMGVNEQAEVLLYQQVQGITTETPLLATIEDSGSKKAFLFGADLWKWRAQVFAEGGSFESFDDLSGKMVQFLASGQRKERLSLNHDNVYYGNENILISAQYFDENYNFDPRGELKLELTNLGKKEKMLVPMSLIGNKYQVKLGAIEAGNYTFTVKAEGTGLSTSGNFTLLDFEVEDQFSTANLSGLQQIAELKETRLYYPEEAEDLITDLLSDNKYVSVQKSRVKNVPLIDWYYLLAFTILFFSSEWFVRKYHGLI